ncbi:YceI family protein [Enterobacter soli]|uniref:YceI family protein n=1 Tax=Enterobacter soli TaxID=885040 RepID=UPI000223CE95|nr:YceI family protein [Enterobacter soli]AEN66064.1 YceI family protein [Enterobacter soli]OAT43546.1 putative exported protein [Enterobacter soli ATCC BAA-2102]
MTRFTTLLIVILFSPMLLAAPVHYDIDQQKTGIVLSWRAFGGILSQAWLKDVTGKVTLDPDNEFNDQIQVTIPVATLVASNSLLTWQLKSNMFFDAARYPTIAFISDRVVTLQKGHFRVFGVLDVREIRRPVILDVTLEEQSPSSLTLNATTAISRSAFGLDRFALVVDDRIAIDINIGAHPQPGSANHPQ